MPDPNHPRRPSDSLDELATQFRRELDRLTRLTHKPNEPRLSLAYLHRMETLAWERVLHGELDAPRRILDQLADSRAFAEIHRPVLPPLEQAAVDLEATLRTLSIADEVTREEATEERLTDRTLPGIEREILRTLLLAGGDYLRRGEVSARLKSTRPVTANRIGQILARLREEKLLLSQERQAQGGKAVSFYTLSPRGRHLCGNLGLERITRTVFDLSPDLPSRLLKLEHLANSDEEAGQVLAFVSYRGGSGRSTTVARVAFDLAKRLEATGKAVLAIDLDLDAPGLDDKFAPGGLGECRGLRGLIFDLLQEKETDRLEWLGHALVSPAYILRPKPTELPNLYYLPTGFGPASPASDAEERLAVRDLFDQEAGLKTPDPRHRADPATMGLLDSLRTALRGCFEKILLDPASGLGISAWIASQVLADELVIQATAEDREVGGLRALLANFAKRQEALQRKLLRVRFLQPIWAETSEVDYARLLCSRLFARHDTCGAEILQNLVYRLPRPVAIVESDAALSYQRFLASALVSEKLAAVSTTVRHEDLLPRTMIDDMVRKLSNPDPLNPHRRITEGLIMALPPEHGPSVLASLVQRSAALGAPLTTQTVKRLARNIAYMDDIVRGRTFKSTRVSLSQLAVETKLSFAPFLAQRHLDIEVDNTSLDRDVQVHGQRELLRHVLVNLIDNAIKYSSANSVISIRGHRLPGGRALEITYRGHRTPEVGSEEVLRHGGPTPEAYMWAPGSAGPGLTLVRKIVEAHRARITCSEVSDGDQKRTVFQVLFPAA